MNTKNGFSHSPRLLWLVIAVTLLRCIAVAYLGTSALHTAEDYLIATNLAAGNGFCMAVGIPTAVKAPFVPLLLSIVCMLAGTTAPMVIVLLQHCMMSASAYLLYDMCMRVFSPRAALWAGVLFLLYPSYLVYPSTIESTPYFLFVAILLLRWFTIHWHERGSLLQAYCLGGVLSAILYLVQPLALPLIGIVWYYFLRSRVGVPLRRMAVVVVVFSLVVAPWVMRNAVVFGKFIPAKSGFWLNFYVGYDIKSHGVADYSVMPSATTAMIDSLETRTNDVQMESEYREAFLNAVKTYPSVYLKKCCVQAIRYWSLPPRYTMNGISLSSIIGRLLPQLLLILCIAFAWRTLWKTYSWLSIVVVCVSLYFTAVYSMTHTTNMRFKLDSEWLLIPLAAVAIDILYQRRVVSSRSVV